MQVMLTKALDSTKSGQKGKDSMELGYQAIDPVTSLPGKRMLLETIYERQALGQFTGSMVMFTINNLVYVACRLDHETAEQIIKDIAVQINNYFTEGVTFKFDEDKFAVVMQESDGYRVKQKVMRFIKRTTKNVLVKYANCYLSMNAGIIELNENDTQTGSILSHSIEALNKSKERGESSVWVHESVANETNIVLAIIKAMEEGRVQYVYQPIIDNMTGRIEYYEALCRINGIENNTLIPPSRFIPALENSTFAHVFDLYTISNALMKLRERPGIKITANVSGRSISNRKFISELEKLVIFSGVEPIRLGLELTETWKGVDKSQSKGFVKAVKRIGCVLILDDFGAGSHSYEDFLELPVDIVKIDGNLIKGAISSEIKHMIVESIQAHAEKMGIKTVAEFVENSEVLELVKDLNFTYSQGFYTGKPQVL